MKHLFLILILSCYFCVYTFAAEDIIIRGDAAAQINLQKKKKIYNHFDTPIPLVEPEVYYDNDQRVIIIVGTGNASYYDVEIKSVTTSVVYVSTTVDGTYDTIDVSSLPDDNYAITLEPPVNISFEGYFSIY